MNDLKAEGRRQQIKQAKAVLAELAKELNALQTQIPNMTHPDVPVGRRLPDGPDGEIRFDPVDRARGELFGTFDL